MHVQLHPCHVCLPKKGLIASFVHMCIRLDSGCPRFKQRGVLNKEGHSADESSNPCLSRRKTRLVYPHLISIIVKCDADPAQVCLILTFAGQQGHSFGTLCVTVDRDRTAVGVCVCVCRYSMLSQPLYAPQQLHSKLAHHLGGCLNIVDPFLDSLQRRHKSSPWSLNCPPSGNLVRTSELPARVFEPNVQTKYQQAGEIRELAADA